MQIIRDTSFQDEIVPCDDRHFINCHIQDCDLRYDGGKLLVENTSFLRCKWTFGGPAVRTLMLVRTFNLMIGSEFSDPMASFSALAGPA